MKKMKKYISLIAVSAVILCLSGCGNTDRPVNADAKENVENNMLDEGMDVDEIINRVENIKDGNVATTDKPAEATGNSTTTATESPAPTETPKPTATPEPTPTPHVHQWTETVTREASCSGEGEKKLTCECGENKVESIPANGNHNFVENTTVVHHEALGHVEEVQVQVGTSDGYTVYSCAFCGASFDTPSGVVDHCATFVPDPHGMANTIATDYPGQPVYETQSQWVVDQPAWDETVGTGTYTCSVCGATK